MNYNNLIIATCGICNHHRKSCKFLQHTQGHRHKTHSTYYRKRN